MPDETPIACSQCFSDTGLRIDAEQIGLEPLGVCANCGAEGFRKLTLAGVGALAHRYFVWGSIWRARYGAAPLVQFNEYQTTSIELKPWLVNDVRLIERLLNVGFFHYGPRLWMVGEIEPLKALQRTSTRQSIIDRILKEYPVRFLAPDEQFYRVRLNPDEPGEARQFDSPPPAYAGRGRLDVKGMPVMYGSQDLEVCIHECRVTAEDLTYVATLAATRPLRLLDLSALLREGDGVTEFESLDLTIHMLFLAGRQAYRIARALAEAARRAGFDGLIYPSYFSLLRSGHMPFETTYGISHRRIDQFRDSERAKIVSNLALFGSPVAAGSVVVKCIDRLMISRVSYEYHFGPTGA